MHPQPIVRAVIEDEVPPRRDRPCPCSQSIVVTTGGLTFPIQPGFIMAFVATPSGNVSTPVNPTTINNLEELLAYLNEVVLPFLIAAGFAVDGAFGFIGGDGLGKPKVDGYCITIILVPGPT